VKVSRALSLPVRLLVIAALAVVPACAKKDTAPPVATPSLTIARPQVAVGSPVLFTYRFDVAPDAKIAADYTVLVHVENADGALLWADDHLPPTPTSQWHGGQHIEYTRLRFIPSFLPLGDLTVRLGLYRGNERLPMGGSDVHQRAAAVATLHLLPQSENLPVLYGTGWNNPEFDAKNPGDEWRWSEGLATFQIRNPRRDATLYVEYAGRPDLFDKPQTIGLWMGKTRLATLPAETTAASIFQLPLTAAALGTGENIDLHLDVDRTFIPAKLPGSSSTDTRVLGVRVFHVFLEPK
jgi:hypothetical protein